MKEDIRTVEFASLLYDFYGELLRENQEEIMNLYHEDNLSLSEIADELGTTRQAVHYTLKKAENTLEQYENKLGLVEKYKNNEKNVLRAKAICERLMSEENLSNRGRKDVEKILEIIEEISE